MGYQVTMPESEIDCSLAPVALNGTSAMSATINRLAADLVKAQAEMQNPPKDSDNPHYRSTYADLATVRNYVIPVLAKHNLAVVQMPSELPSGGCLVTMLVHTSGEWMSSTMLLRNVKNDPQGIGSAITYARRQSLMAIAGVAGDDDDDGNAGSDLPPTPQRTPVKPKEPASKPKAVTMTADQYAEQLRRASTLEKLSAAWECVPPAMRPNLVSVKDVKKQQLVGEQEVARQ